MKLSSTAVHAGMAAIALVAVYVTWQREPVSSGEAVVVLDHTRKDLQTLRYDDPSKWIELRPTGEGEGVWVKIGHKAVPVAEAADGGNVADAGTAAPTAPDRELRGNEFAQKLFKKFAPLRATRALGVVDDGKLDELGLKTPLRRLEVQARGRQERFDVGASGLGISSPYLRAQDGKVYLLGGGIISEFDMGQGRLVDRNLHAFTTADFDELRVTAGPPDASGGRAFVQLPGATAAQNKLAAKESPTVPDEFAKNWHDKVWRGYAAELYGRDEAPPEPTKSAFRIDYFRKGTPIGFIEAAPGEKNFYARTEHTAGWVKLSAAEGVVPEAVRVAEKGRK